MSQVTSINLFMLAQNRMVHFRVFSLNEISEHRKLQTIISACFLTMRTIRDLARTMNAHFIECVLHKIVINSNILLNFSPFRLMRPNVYDYVENLSCFLKFKRNHAQPNSVSTTIAAGVFL